MSKPKANEAGAVTRRRFLRSTGLATCAAFVGGNSLLADGMVAIPVSDGFLLVDLKKCQGCGTCMMACSLAHSGEASYTLGRIQIQQDSFQNFPGDIFMATCRQCDNAPCVPIAEAPAQYRPRHPERTGFCQLFAAHFERYLRAYEERFEPRAGPLPPAVVRAEVARGGLCLWSAPFSPTRLTQEPVITINVVGSRAIVPTDSFGKIIRSNVCSGPKRNGSRSHPFPD